MYVGESKCMLKTRITEHNWKSKQTAVYQHTSKCPNFTLALSQKIVEEPTSKRLTPRQISKIRLQKITDQFTILASNLSNYYKRTDYEAMFITIYKPKLNEQVHHKSVTII